MREYGKLLFGPPPSELIPPVADSDLKREVASVFLGWGEELLAKKDWSQWYVSFTVNAYCRMLHTLHTGEIGSKPFANRWAIDNLDSRWGSLIEEAWALRDHPEKTIHVPAEPEITERTVEFVRMAMKLCRDSNPSPFTWGEG